MVGLGETAAEVEALLRDLRKPASTSRRWANTCSPRDGISGWPNTSTPQQFDAYRDYGLSIGFEMVFSGPLVRSSYMADLVSEQATHS